LRSAFFDVLFFRKIIIISPTTANKDGDIVGKRNTRVHSSSEKGNAAHTYIFLPWRIQTEILLIDGQ